MPCPRAAALLLLALFSLPSCQKSTPAVDEQLGAPTALLEAARDAGARKIFVNPAARNFFSERGLALAPADARDGVALREPPLWRRLDRAQRFDAVLLAGRAGEFDPLLRHLADSPDFRLARVDNWGALFVRGARGSFVPPAPEDAAGEVRDERQRALVLAHAALMLEAVALTRPADAYLTTALRTAPEDPDVLVAAAALALSRGDYRVALERAAQARRKNDGHPGAMEISARAYAGAGARDQAYAAATALKAASPSDDLNVLYLHARLANAARAFGAEQESLEQLVRVAERQGLPTGAARVYLGQSYARQGLARPALEQLELAAKDDSLSPKQRADLDEAITNVRQRVGGLSTP